ncbi:MAG: prohibitin family protein [Spirochaetota bacterium]
MSDVKTTSKYSSIKKFFRSLRIKARRNLLYLTITSILVLGLCFIFIKRIVYIILPGEAAIRWSLFTGTQIGKVYSEGIHFISPLDRLYIYNVRIQELSREIDVLTKTGLKVRLFLSIRYAPQQNILGLLHQKVGPDYANVVIIPEIEAVLREIIGTLEAEQIYTTGREVIVEAINNAIEQVAQRYIDVDDVLIKRITLPESIEKAIKFKIEQKQLVEAHKFMVLKAKEEAKRKRIEGEGIRDRLKIIASAIPKGEILKWEGIKATKDISTSQNAKVIVIGGGKDGLPIILNSEK